MSTTVEKMAIEVTTKANTSGLDQVNVRLDALKGRLSTIGSGLGSALSTSVKSLAVASTAAITAVAAVGGSVIAAGIASLQSAAEMQQLKRALLSVAGSTEEANKQFVELKEVAKLPGINLETAVKASVTLQSVGYSAEKAKQILSEFGNAVALTGGGSAQLDGIVIALTQMQGKGKLVTQDFNQIAERLPQIRKLTQEAFGTSNLEALNKQGVTIDKFVDGITKKLAEMPRAASGLSTMFEVLSDAQMQLRATFGEKFAEAFNVEGIIQKATEQLEAFTEWLDKNGSDVAKNIQSGFQQAYEVVKPLIEAIVEFVQTVWEKWGDDFLAFTENLWNFIKDIFQGAVQIITNVFKVFTALLTGDWSALGQALQNIIQAAWNTIISIFAASIKNIGIAFAGFVGLFNDSWGDKIRNGAIEAGDALKERFITPLEGVTSAAQEATAAVNETVKAANKTTKTKTATSTLTNSQKRDAEKFAEQLKSTLKNLKFNPVADTISILEEADRFQKSINIPIELVPPTPEEISAATQIGDKQIAIPITFQENDEATTNLLDRISAMKGAYEEFSAAASDALAAVGNGFATMIADVFTFNKDALRSFGQLFANVIRAMIAQAIKLLAIQAALSFIPGFGTAIGAGFKGASFGQKLLGGALGFKVPFFADGGIVTKPTLGMIGEAGAEAVIPLDALNRIINSSASQPTFEISTGIHMDTLVSKIRKTEKRQSRSYGF